jgi:hypothetical protein
MTPNAADVAATPNPLPDCRFCGAVGVQTLMRKWCGVPRTIFLHPECQAVLQKLGVITETWWGERRMNLADLDSAKTKFFTACGTMLPNAPLQTAERSGKGGVAL